jgi:hypothetical protein
MKSEFETWPATPVKASLKSTKIFSDLDLAEVASFYKTEQPGSAGHPAHSQFAIVGCRIEEPRFQSAIGN